MNRDPDLLDTLRRLASALPREASPEVQQRVKAAFRARQSRRAPVWFYAAAACAALLLGMAVLRQRQAVAPRADSVYNVSDFIALPYSQSGVPLEHAVVIRVRMRPSDLSSMGVAVPAAASTAQFDADVLVGQDGVARAVRLVQ